MPSRAVNAIQVLPVAWAHELNLHVRTYYDENSRHGKILKHKAYGGPSYR